MHRYLHGFCARALCACATFYIPHEHHILLHDLSRFLCLQYPKVLILSTAAARMLPPSWVQHVQICNRRTPEQRCCSGQVHSFVIICRHKLLGLKVFRKGKKEKKREELESCEEIVGACLGRTSLSMRATWRTGMRQRMRYLGSQGSNRGVSQVQQRPP